MQNFRQWALAAALLTTAALPASANELAESATQLCDKIKQCTIAQMGEADLTPAMRQRIEPMINSMCYSMRAGIEEVPTNHELYQPAVACMKSMASLSCDDFQDANRVQTPECKDYQEQAEAAMDQ